MADWESKTRRLSLPTSFHIHQTTERESGRSCSSGSVSPKHLSVQGRTFGFMSSWCQGNKVKDLVLLGYFPKSYYIYQCSSVFYWWWRTGRRDASWFSRLSLLSFQSDKKCFKWADWGDLMRCLWESVYVGPCGGINHFPKLNQILTLLPPLKRKCDLPFFGLWRN